MPKHLRALLPVLCITIFGASKAQLPAQDTIFLLNGQVVSEKIIDTALGAVTIYHPEKHGRKIHYEWDQLFMVKYANGDKRFYYTQDSTIDNWFTRDEMWMYMKGENDARRGFKASGALWGAGVAGIIGGMTGTLWGPIPPLGFMALSGIPKVRIRHSTVSDPRYLESDAYILGYERVARQRRKIRSLIGGAVGLAVGYGVFAVFHTSYPESIR